MQPTDTYVNTAISPSPAVEVVETNSTTSATDTVAGIPITLDYSGGSGELSGGSGSLTATSASTTINSQTVNAAVYSLTPTTIGSSFSLSLGSGGNGIAVGSTTFTGISDHFAVNNPLAVTAGTTVVYDLGQPSGVVLDSALTVTDATGSTLAGATVWIGAGFQGSADTLTFINQNGITGSYNAGTGVLTLTGAATATNYQSALQSVAFSTTSSSTSPRTIQWVVNNGVVTSSAVTSTVDIGSAAQVVVSGYPTTAYVGVPEHGTVQVEDQYNNVVTTASGSATVSTSQSATPILVTITNGVGTFTTSFSTIATGQSITAAFSTLTATPETASPSAPFRPSSSPTPMTPARARCAPRWPRRRPTAPATSPSIRACSARRRRSR